MTVISGLTELRDKRRALRSLRRAQDDVGSIIENAYDIHSDFTTIKRIADQLALSRVVVRVGCAVCQKPLEVIYRVGESGEPQSALCTECNEGVGMLQETE